ncbi:3-oxoacyl-[acyl-carrier protein] reductase [Actinacidiphila alni]|uniref:3-oxoacyl-[acyl-carrier protein] reductase n=1 Tax=Actinacidiphila alni TaxID=380248 RepID=A0A1I2D4E8_9ACTN|nr:3-oxoacyl-ACP reductase [Actinacidiphila alni]SFE75408.1 3-oxoacyl-[acyl-carrier protein] reductase [Actinacidiphila alni]
MADRYLRLTGTAPGRFLTRRLGLPQPTPLRRWSAEHPALDGAVLRLTAGDIAEPRAEPLAAVVLDATAIAEPVGLGAVHASLHPLVRSLAACGRVVVLGARIDPADPHQAAAQQALEGFVRSLGKEIGRGRTVQLVRLAPGADAEAALGFLLSPKSAYVSGQVIEVGPAPEGGPGGPGKRRVALVTGAARGIGEQVAATLARDGAHVICLDVPQAADALTAVADRLGGSALPLDITAPDAGERIAAAVQGDGGERVGGLDGPGGLDVLVHNAGITRDRKLANMPADRWDPVLDVNLGSVLRTTDHLLKSGALTDRARIVATASISGIAGNAGQTNYAASKAGIIGFVRALAAVPEVRERGITVNAVAPGFIETRMTAAVPLFIREAGRRMNSLGQGGLPIDVAETVAWLAAAGSGGITGQVVRVCGQSLLGA